MPWHTCSMHRCQGEELSKGEISNTVSKYGKLSCSIILLAKFILQTLPQILAAHYCCHPWPGNTRPCKSCRVAHYSFKWRISCLRHFFTRISLDTPFHTIHTARLPLLCLHNYYTYLTDSTNRAVDCPHPLVWRRDGGPSIEVRVANYMSLKWEWIKENDGNMTTLITGIWKEILKLKYKFIIKRHFSSTWLAPVECKANDHNNSIYRLIVW